MPGEPIDRVDELAVAIEADHGIDLREGLFHLDSEPLGHAADHDRLGVGALGVLGLEDGVDRLPAGLLDEGTGVDHHDVGRLR